MLIGALLIVHAVAAHAHPEPLQGFIAFPEYDVRTACLGDRAYLLPDLDCMDIERVRRVQLLGNWAEVGRQYEPKVSACASLVSHPDAAPASYVKLLDCIAGELYASE